MKSLVFVFVFSFTFALAQKQYPYVANHSDEINAIHFSPDGGYVLSGGWDSKLLVHRTDSTNDFVQTRRDNRGALKTISFSRDGKKMVTGGQDGVLRIYDFDSVNYEPASIDTTINLESQINKLIYGPGMRMVFVGLDNGEFVSYDLVKREIRRTNAKRPISAFGVSVDRMSYFIALEGDPVIHQFDIFGKELRTYAGHTNDITDIVVSVDRKTIISASKDKSVRIWNIASGKEEIAWTDHTWAVTDIDIDGFGQFLISGGLDGVVNLYDLKAKTMIDSFHLSDYKINAVSWCPDNTKIAAAAHPEGITNPSGYFILPTNLKARKIVLAKQIDLEDLREKNEQRALQREWDKALREMDKQEAQNAQNKSDDDKKRIKIRNKKTIDKTDQVEVTIEDDE